MATIYLSSTYEDLKDYRGVVFEALRKSGYQIIAMEMVRVFSAIPIGQSCWIVANIVRELRKH